jgi:uncharacterized protein (TIGR02271 family)
MASKSKRQHRTGSARDLSQIQQGWDVYDANEEKIGDVSQVSADALVVSKGLFFPKDRYVPASSIVRIERDRVFLDLTKADLDAERWDAPKQAASTHADTASSQADARRLAGDRETMELREEELVARKQTAQAGEVRIRKDVVAEQQTIDVPVTREEVYVERHSVDRPASDRDFDEERDTLRVPVHEEQVNVQKTARVYEEIEVGKQAVQETQRVAETVKKEVPVIDHDDGVPVHHRESGISHAEDRHQERPRR